jgi:glycosyltransferase involved in cell wall biosynthesis
MKLSVVIPVLNQFPLVQQTLKFLSQDATRPYELIVIDNGSDEEFKTDLPDVKVIRYDDVLGSYPAFKIGLQESTGDVIAYFHSDFFVYEQGWEKRVLAEFEKDPRLGMIGFIGSNEIDQLGGRGGGTTSNFQGKNVVILEDDMIGGQRTKYTWSGSPAEAHGKRNSGFTRAAVVDGCSMILRRTALQDIGFRDNFPLHHFYDRLIATQLLEKRWHIGVLGVECDHISGQTANAEEKWKQAARKWSTEHHISPGGLGIDWDHVIYLEAERQWLSEYRDKKHLIPIRI